MGEKNKTAKGILLALSGGVLWGFSGTCGQYLFDYKNMNPEWLTSVRLLFSGIIMIILILITQRKNMKGILSDKYDRIVLVVFGIVGLLTCQYTYFVTISNSNAATGTVLQYLGPAMIMIFMCFRSKRMPNIKELTAVIFAMTGTFLLATHGSINELAISPKALTFGILSALSLAAYSIIPGRIIERWGSLTVTGLGMFIAGVVFTLIVRAWTIKQSLDFGAVFVVLLIIIFGTVIPFTTYLKSVSYIGAAKASMISCMEPLSATIISAIWLKNKFMPIDILGFALIIITVLMLSFKGKNSKN